jgi:tetratricopeptide (TPR) repeat protein
MIERQTSIGASGQPMVTPSIVVRPEFWIEQAHQSAQRGQSWLAARQFRAAIVLQPQDASSRFNFGIALHNLQCFDEAVASVQMASRLDPSWTQARDTFRQMKRDQAKRHAESEERLHSPTGTTLLATRNEVTTFELVAGELTRPRPTAVESLRAKILLANSRCMDDLNAATGLVAEIDRLTIPAASCDCMAALADRYPHRVVLQLAVAARLIGPVRSQDPMRWEWSLTDHHLAAEKASGIAWAKLKKRSEDPRPQPADFSNLLEHAAMIHARALQIVGRQEDAIHIIQSSVTRLDLPQIAILISDLAMDLGQTDCAIESLQRLLQSHPEHLHAQFLLARLDGECHQSRSTPISNKVQVPSEPGRNAAENESNEVAADHSFEPNKGAVDQPHRNVKAATQHMIAALQADRTGDYEGAVDHLLAAAEFKRPSHSITRAPLNATPIIEAFNAQLLGKFSNQARVGFTPIFVIGVPRSGTTMIEQILSSHPSVAGAGELHDTGIMYRNFFSVSQRQSVDVIETGHLSEVQIQTCARRYAEPLRRMYPNAKNIVDKMPTNFIHLGWIQLLFPEARILHCIRDCRDVCVSAMRADLSWPFCHPEAFLGYHEQYERLMAHWTSISSPQILPIQYETFVEDFDPQVSSMLSFLGLDDCEACHHFEQSNRPVRTPTRTQVRQPIHATSVGRWKRYEQPLRDRGFDQFCDYDSTMRIK